MSIPYKIHILKSPDLSTPHLALSVPDNYFNAKAMILDAGSAEEQTKLLDFIEQVSGSKQITDSYRTNSYEALMITGSGENLEIISHGNSPDRKCTVSAKAFSALLKTWLLTLQVVRTHPSGYKILLEREKVNILEESMLILKMGQTDEANVLLRLIRKTVVCGS